MAPGRGHTCPVTRAEPGHPAPAGLLASHSREGRPPSVAGVRGTEGIPSLRFRRRRVCFLLQLRHRKVDCNPSPGEEKRAWTGEWDCEKRLVRWPPSPRRTRRRKACSGVPGHGPRSRRAKRATRRRERNAAKGSAMASRPRGRARLPRRSRRQPPRRSQRSDGHAEAASDRRVDPPGAATVAGRCRTGRRIACIQLTTAARAAAGRLSAVRTFASGAIRQHVTGRT
jgi:hypothetical protein